MTVTTSPTEQDDLSELVNRVREGAEANERPDLMRRLRTAAELLAGSPAGTADATVAASVMRALQSLEVDLRARRVALCEPGRAARLTAESRHAEIRLRRYQERAAKWPRMLSDALAAADSDVEFAVQSRLRSLLDEGTATIESTGKRGADFEQWLRERLLAEVEACYGILRTAADGVTEQIATALELTGAVPPVRLAPQPAEELVSDMDGRRRGPSNRPPLATRLVGIIMPTYSGIMIALVLPRLFGLQLPLWLIVAAGLAGACAMGGSALAGERQRQNSRRTAEAVGELRSSVDTLRMAVSKQVRDGARSVEQQLRAGVAEAVARQTRRLTADAETSRNLAQDIGHAERALRDVDADLESVRELQLRARRLAPGDRLEAADLVTQ